jgi:hypothetical protein
MLSLSDSRADYYAAQNGQTPVGPYTSWTTAASSIQDAVNAAPTNGVVWVGAGRYTIPTNAVFYQGTNVVYIYKPLILRSSNGVPARTVIDGQGKHRGVTWYYPYSSTNRFLLDGFTVSNCWATNTGSGIYIVPSVWTAEVQNCIISDNLALCTQNVAYAYAAGAGIYGSLASGFGMTVSNCIIRNNHCTNTTMGTMSTAGGAYIYGTGRKLVTHCLIESNSGARSGGLLMGYSPMTVENSILRGNRSLQEFDSNDGGGGVSFSSGEAFVRNCLIYNNSAGKGGGIYKFASPITGPYTGLLEVVNCTIASNVTTEIASSAIRFRRLDRLYLCNSIIYSNNIPVYGDWPMYFTNSWIVSTSVVNGVNGVGNITNGIDPAFIGVEDKDFRLTPSSPCFNTGTNQDWMINTDDLDGRKRIRYGSVDIGAYELINDATIYKFR